MKREVSIGSLDKDVYEGDLTVSRFEYLPVATASIKNHDATDAIEAFESVAEIIEKGESMRDVMLGDDKGSVSFVREDGQKTVMVTVKKGDAVIQLPYDIDELAVAIRFITAENSIADDAS